jgi:hypothetical protein
MVFFVFINRAIHIVSFFTINAVMVIVNAVIVDMVIVDMVIVDMVIVDAVIVDTVIFGAVIANAAIHGGTLLVNQDLPLEKL